MPRASKPSPELQLAQQEIERLKDIITIMNGVTANQTSHHPPSGPPYMPFRTHPLTCGNDSNHAPLYPYYDRKKGVIMLLCGDCEYTQLVWTGLARHCADTVEKLSTVNDGA